MCCELSTSISYAKTRDTQHLKYPTAQSRLAPGTWPEWQPGGFWQAGKSKTEQLLKLAEKCEM